jgi:intraflagellar transport protein 172
MFFWAEFFFFFFLFQISAQWAKAAQLVEDTLNGDVAKPYFMRIANHYRDKKRFDLAEKYFVQAGKPNEAVDMYTRANKWEAAHRVAVRFMSENEASMLYINQAQEHERKGMFGDAERLYLTVNEPDLAINMYKKARKFDQMLRLVSQYRKELLKDTNLHLAQQLEMEGTFREAETYYVEAGEWQSAVNMWRANDSWDEAIRIAKFHGGVQASQRVAYAWALSIGGAEGSKLLTRLGLIEQAIDYATESGNFDHAFELANNSLKSKVPEVHLKHALFLEDEEKFEEAKDEFLNTGKPREAIDMFIHQQDWASATRVAESYEPAALPDVLVAQARSAVSSNDFQRAESLFISAKKPQLALKMFEDAARWQDAIRVAKRHLPHKLAEVNESYSQYSKNGGVSPVHNQGRSDQNLNSSIGSRRRPGSSSGDKSSNSGQSQSDVLAAARNWEETGHWDRAVEAYLDVTLDHVGGNQHALSEIWLKAVKVSNNHQDRRKASEVTRMVADRLADNRMKKYESAGDLYRNIEMFREAVQAFVDGRAWNKARQTCDQDAPKLRNMVEEAYQSHMSNAGDASGLVSAGNITQGLDIYAQKGQWDELFDVCDKSAPEQGPRYATIYANQLIDDGNRIDQAIQVLGRFGADPSEEHLTLYKKIIKDFLGRTKDKLSKSSATQSPEILAVALRKMLYKLVNDMKSGKGSGSSGRRGGSSKYNDDSSSGHLPWFEKALMTVHYVVMRDKFTSWNMTEVATQTSVALLRFCDVIPPDKAFYLAGMACKENKDYESMAFVLLNHYLDISEAIEEGDASTIDNSDFVGTDIPAPFDYALPKVQFLNDDKREEVRDWVSFIEFLYFTFLFSFILTSSIIFFFFFFLGSPNINESRS